MGRNCNCKQLRINCTIIYGETIFTIIADASFTDIKFIIVLLKQGSSFHRNGKALAYTFRTEKIFIK